MNLVDIPAQHTMGKIGLDILLHECKITETIEIDIEIESIYFEPDAEASH